MLSIWSSFADLPDPRTGNAQRHNLLDVLTIALTGRSAGPRAASISPTSPATARRCSATFSTCPAACQATIPSRGCSGCWTRQPSPRASRGSSTGWARPAPASSPSTARRCGAPSTGPPDDRPCTSSPPSLPRRGPPAAPPPAALQSDREDAMGVGQVVAGDKESEIIAARTLLGLLDLKGVRVTGDALHCQGETARLITERGGDWLFTLKATTGPSSTTRSPPGSPTRSPDPSPSP
jgi:hypothetical protein